MSTPLCHPSHFPLPFAAKCVFSACLILWVHSINADGNLWVGSGLMARLSWVWLARRQQSVVQDDIQQRAVNLQVAVVGDESLLSKLVHGRADFGATGA